MEGFEMKGIVIVNMHLVTFTDGHRIDRSSVLGNPFVMNKDADQKVERTRVCDLYHRWLWDRMKEKGKEYQYLNELVDEYVSTQSLILRCWCAPLRCHGESIKAAVLWMASNR